MLHRREVLQAHKGEKFENRLLGPTNILKQIIGHNSSAGNNFLDLTTIFGHERSSFHWFFLPDSTQAWEPLNIAAGSTNPRRNRVGPCRCRVTPV
jgi:hypothetical protein